VLIAGSGEKIIDKIGRRGGATVLEKFVIRIASDDLPIHGLHHRCSLLARERTDRFGAVDLVGDRLLLGGKRGHQWEYS